MEFVYTLLPLKKMDQLDNLNKHNDHKHIELFQNMIKANCYFSKEICMKNYVVYLFLIFGVGRVFACPGFSGNYTCFEGDGSSYDLKIEQIGVKFTIIDDDGTQEYIADSKARVMEGMDELVNASYSASCEGQTVLINVNGIFLEEMEGEIPVQVRMTHTRKDDGSIGSTTDIISEGFNETETTDCIKE
jgi:hypothetical protein